MTDDLNAAFNKYLTEVKKLDKNGKREEVLNSVKTLIATIDSLAILEGIKLNYLRSDIPNTKDPNLKEEEFLEAILIYIEEAKCLLGEFLNNKIM